MRYSAEQQVFSFLSPLVFFFLSVTLINLLNLRASLIRQKLIKQQRTLQYPYYCPGNIPTYPLCKLDSLSLTSHVESRNLNMRLIAP